MCAAVHAWQSDYLDGLELTLASAADAQMPVPRWQSEDGATSIKLRGRVMLDFADVDWSSPTTGAPSDTSEFRTARMGIEARHGDFKLVAEFDFASDNTAANDVYLSYASPVGDFRAGHFKTMNSLDELTSGRFTTFMERGLATDLFHLDRRIGLSYTWHGHGVVASAGIFGGRMDNNFRFAEADDSAEPVPLPSGLTGFQRAMVRQYSPEPYPQP